MTAQLLKTIEKRRQDKAFQDLVRKIIVREKRALELLSKR
jgi:hypothetical protein